MHTRQCKTQRAQRITDFESQTDFKKTKNSTVLSSAVLKKKSQSKSVQSNKVLGVFFNEIDYKVLELIGKGAFGCVFKAREKRNQRRTVAIKKIFLDPTHINRELDIMKVIKHENCVQLFDHFIQKEFEEEEKIYINIVMDYYPKTLKHIIESSLIQKSCDLISDFKGYIFQLFNALEYLHSLSICHRDIKPQNILIDPETSRLVLCDFGSAKRFDESSKSVSYIGSRFYRAPELILEAELYDTKIDVWSAGCVVAEMILGQPIFKGKNSASQLETIFSVLGKPKRKDVEKMNINLDFFEKCDSIQKTSLSCLFSQTSILFVDFLSNLLQFNPKKRFSAHEALSHSFFREITLDQKNRLKSSKSPSFHFLNKK